jgi:hypothetical protein
MDHTAFDVQSVLHKVAGEKWRGLTAGAFTKKFVNEVMELEEAVCVRTYNVTLPHHGASEVFVLSNGLSVLCSAAQRFSLFETQERVEERELKSAWADFVRGTWVDHVPQEAGSYFVRDRETGRRSVRELIRREGRLLDIGGGFVRAGRVTEWSGDWWVPRIPRLPGSY